MFATIDAFVMWLAKAFGGVFFDKLSRHYWRQRFSIYGARAYS